MANDNPGSAAMADAEQAQDPNQDPNANRQPERAHEPEDIDGLKAEREKLKTALAKANKEAADRRRRLEELEAKEKEAEQAQLTEAERIRNAAGEALKKRQEAEERARKAEEALVATRIDHAVERAAAGRMEYPEIAPSLVDRSRISYDPETGKVDGAKEAVDRLLKDKPGLDTTNRGGGTPPREGPRRSSAGTTPTQTSGRQERPPTPDEEVAALGGYF